MCQVWFHAFSVKSDQGSQRRPKGNAVYVNFSIPPSLDIMQVKKSLKITFSSISPYSHNISFSPSYLHFRPDFSLLPIVYFLPPVEKGNETLLLTALFMNTRTLKFKNQLKFAFFAVVNHLNGPLGKQKFQKVKICDLWLVDFDPFCVFLCFKVHCLWS